MLNSQTSLIWNFRLIDNQEFPHQNVKDDSLSLLFG